MGKYEKSDSIISDVRIIQEKIVGKNHLDYSKTLNLMAIISRNIGNYEKSEYYHNENIKIIEKEFGKESVEYARVVMNMAVLYNSIGDYDKSELLFITAKAIQEKKLGKEHLEYSMTLNGLSNLYLDLKSFDKAEIMFIESKEIREKKLGKNHPDYAQSLGNLGTLYWNKGDYEKAKRYYMESIEIREKILGNQHLDYVESISNLAGLYSKMGNYENAVQMHLQSKTIIEKLLGKFHFKYELCINNLAAVYLKQRDFEKSQPLLLEAREVCEKFLGKDHPYYIHNLDNLLALYLLTNNSVAARPLIDESSSIQKSLLLKATHHLSEHELSSYTEKFIYGLSLTYSFATLQPDISPSCYDNTLFHKGFLQNAAARVNRPVLPDSATTEQYYLFKSLHRRLAAEYAKPIAERKNVDTLENRANELEKKLTRKIAGYGEALRQVKWQEVQAALKPGEAAIEFVHYNYWNKKETDSTMYAALVLRPGMEQPLFVPLFEEKQLTALLDPNGQSPEVFHKNCYAFEQSGKSLYQVVWGPLEAHLQGAKKVFCSPSGLLHRLSLADLPTGNKASIGDIYDLSIISSTRQLVVSQPVVNTKKTALFFGGIQYDMDSTAYFNTSDTRSGNGMRGAPTGFYADSTLRGGSWKYLPGTEKEATELSQTAKSKGFDSQVLLGFTASEERFKALDGQSPQILHLATHGFFFPDAENKSGTGLDNEPVFKYNDNPLLRAGLILAGGNHAWTKGRPLRPDMEDGILTAYEIAHLDLSKTELVVLSACETGLGDIRGNEGVYGLQRAFKIAGVKNILMSLWQVPDQQTARFMGIFYKKWLNDNLSISDALQATKKQLKDRGYDPFYWAGFILVE
jgi:CHAT domain-containing protein